MSSRRGEIAVALAIVGVLALTVVPVPAILVDALLALSLCAAMLTFLVAFYVEKPLEFSSFPALLLFVTLFRLSLNVASTRLILADGDGGGSQIISAFGEFAVAGNFVVGAVVFLILVIVNFIVITKGAERVSEVSARFTLDSLPGKQMAVDADLGAGLINEEQAKKRRADIAHEADFHGAMDGASKFVRGDAIAGLLITGINIIGGMVIGLAQKDMSAGEAATTFTVLSIGDGLVSQIPALLVSTAAALLITRTGDSPVSSSLGKQLIGKRRPLAIAAIVIAFLGLLPGMPHIVFLSLAGIVGYVASRAGKAKAQTSGDGVNRPALGAGSHDVDATDPADPIAQRAELESMIPVDLLSLDVGLDLLPMVDADRGGELLVRIASMRKQIASELGLLIPPVHVRDDLRLATGAYKIVVSGVELASGQTMVGHLLAIDPSGRATSGIEGQSVIEPTFGLPAKWIATSERGRAEAAGCTVVAPSAVVATHLTEIIRRHAADLLGRREAQELLDIAARSDEKVVEELIPHLLSVGEVIAVLRNLLAENISIRDMRTILETLADHAAKIKEPDELTELVRERLSRRITREHTTGDGTLRPMVLSPESEDLFRAGTARDAAGLSRLTAALERRARAAADRDEPALLVVAPDIRRAVAGVAARHVPGLAVMSYREVDPNVAFQTSCVITAEETAR